VHGLRASEDYVSRLSYRASRPQRCVGGSVLWLVVKQLDNIAQCLHIHSRVSYFFIKPLKFLFFFPKSILDLLPLAHSWTPVCDACYKTKYAMPQQGSEMGTELTEVPEYKATMARLERYSTMLDTGAYME